MQALLLAGDTWSKEDGVPMIDYSSQDQAKRLGAHCQSINTAHFQKFIGQLDEVDRDIMLEIKDKEVSALKAVQLL